MRTRAVIPGAAIASMALVVFLDLSQPRIRPAASGAPEPTPPEPRRAAGVDTVAAGETRASSPESPHRAAAAHATSSVHTDSAEIPAEIFLADVTGDGVLSNEDAMEFALRWSTGSPLADWNADRTVDSADLAAFLDCFFSGST